MKYELIIFDFDGTLVDTLPWLLRHLDEITDRFGIRRVDPSEVESLRTLSARELMRHLKVPVWRLPAISAHVRRLAKGDWESLSVFPGIFDSLDTLHRNGAKIAVVSSNSKEIIRLILQPALSIICHIEGAVPLFGKAARLRRVTRSVGVDCTSVLSVGDEIRDAVAAWKAGIAFGAVGWGMTNPKTLLAQSPSKFFGCVEDLKLLQTSAS